MTKRIHFVNVNTLLRVHHVYQNMYCSQYFGYMNRIIAYSEEDANNIGLKFVKILQMNF